MAEAKGPSLLYSKNVPFDLQGKEQVLLVARRHWAFLLWVMLVGLLFAVVPAVIFIVALSMGGWWAPWAAIVLAVWAVIWLIRAYFAWYKYNHDMWVVTNQRVIDSSKSHWFNHEMASVDLVGVEDMSIRKSGLFPTMFGYGDLLLQTAGQQKNFVVSGIADPADVLALVDEKRDAARRELHGVTA